MRLAIPDDTRSLLKAHGNRIENASLVFERFLLPLNFGQNSAIEKDKALKRLIQTAPVLGYSKRAEHLIHLIRSSFPSRNIITIGKLNSRMAVNLSDGLIQNAGICLDRLLGIPFIPASAFKGCCHHAAYWMCEKSELDKKLLEGIFGFSENDNNQRGWVTFFPVYPIDLVRLELDILTPHPVHNGNESNPIPNKFPVIGSGTRFAFACALNNTYKRSQHADPKALFDVLKRIIKEAFENGFGAKTAAGHGWFLHDVEFEKEQREREEAAEQQRQEDERMKQQQQQQKLKILQEKELREAAIKEAEARKIEAAKAEEKIYESASPLEKLRIDMSKLSKDAFLAEMKKLADKNPEEQRICLEVFLTKNPKARNKILKDKKAGPIIKQHAQALEISL